MPEITRNPALVKKILADMRKRAEESRADRDKDGLPHLTELTFCLNKAVLARLYGQPRIDDQTLLLFALGHAFQAAITGVLDSDAHLEHDGVSLSPDWIESIPPWEVKLTYKSSNAEPQTYWLKQMAGYGYVMGKRVWEIPRLNVMGDWKWEDKDNPGYDKKGTKVSGRPVLTGFRVRFTQGELDANWAWVLARRDLLLRCLMTGEFPSDLVDDYAEAWECERCQLREMCPKPMDDSQ